MKDRERVIGGALAMGVAIVGTLAAAAPAGAACDDDAKNLLAKRNCAFASGVEGWEGLEAEIAHEGGDGSPARGALAATASDGFALVLGPCVKTKGRASYRVSARVRVTSGEVHSCAVAARQYTDGACEEDREVLETDARVTPPTGEWQTMSGAATPERDADSAQLHLECNGEGEFRVLFDDVVLAR